MALTRRQQAVVLAGITFAVFFPTLSAGFVYDARMQILTGEFIHQWRHWPAVLTGRVLGMDVLDFNRPAMLASLMLDAAVWGRDPFGYHLTSVLLHVVNVLLVWRLIDVVAPPGVGAGPAARLWPLLATLVFAVHPLVAEAVCEPTYREDLLVAACTLAALVLALRHDPQTAATDALRALACAACCLLAVASKEAGVAAPLLLASAWWLLRGGEPGRFWALAIGGGMLAAVGFLAARFLLEPATSSIFITRPVPLGGSPARALLLGARILALYAQLVVAPVNLCADYGLASIRHLPLWLAAAILLLLAAAAMVAARYDRRMLFACLMIVLPLVPVANIVPIYRPAADRYLYLSLAGVAVAFARLLDAPWVARRPDRRRRLAVGGIGVVAALGLCCIGRQQVWMSELALWDDTLRKNPFSETAALGLGEALRGAGRLPEAERATRQAIRLSQGRRGDAYATLALILDARGRRQDAAEAVAVALRIEPRLADPDACVAALAMDRPTADALERLLAETRPAGWPPARK